MIYLAILAVLYTSSRRHGEMWPTSIIGGTHQLIAMAFPNACFTHSENSMMAPTDEQAVAVIATMEQTEEWKVRQSMESVYDAPQPLRR